MPKDTKVIVKSTMTDFLQDRYDGRRRDIRRTEHRNFTQNEWAGEIGIVAQTLGRYMNGDTGMTMDSAVMLLRYFGESILPYFEYNNVLDMDTAIILAKWPQLNDEQRKLVLSFFQNPSDEAHGLDINALQTI